MSAFAQPPSEHDLHVGIRDLRHDLSAYLKRAADGETIVVTDRGRPIVRLVPEPRRQLNSLERAIAEGRVTATTVDKATVLALPPLQRAPGSPTMSEILTQMRDEDPR